jgi:hypothetical protein
MSDLVGYSAYRMADAHRIQRRRDETDLKGAEWKVAPLGGEGLRTGGAVHARDRLPVWGRGSE